MIPKQQTILTYLNENSLSYFKMNTPRKHRATSKFYYEYQKELNMSVDEYEKHLNDLAENFESELPGDDEALTYDEMKFLDQIKSDKEEKQYLEDPTLSYEIEPDEHLFDSYDEIYDVTKD